MKRRFQIGIMLLLSEYILGGVGYKVLSPETPILDCLYMAVITVTTVGYSEVIQTTASPILRSYTLLLILAGTGVMLYSVSVVTAYIVEGDLNQYFWKRRMQRRIASMKDHFIVCGAGETGLRIVEELDRTQRDFVVIDPDSERGRSLSCRARGSDHRGSVRRRTRPQSRRRRACCRRRGRAPQRS